MLKYRVYKKTVDPGNAPFLTLDPILYVAFVSF